MGPSGEEGNGVGGDGQMPRTIGRTRRGAGPVAYRRAKTVWYLYDTDRIWYRVSDITQIFDTNHIKMKKFIFNIVCNRDMYMYLYI